MIMGNYIQRAIYNFSTVSPLCFVFAVVWYMQNKTLKIPLVCFSVGVALIICFAISFSYAKKHLAPITIRASDIAPYDGWVLAYILTYLLPFASIVIKDFNVIVCTIITAILAVVAPFLNTAIPNPLLFAKGYHFYQISAEQGVSCYTLISKQKLRKAKDLKTVNRIFDFLLLDTRRWFKCLKTVL